jgi:hypothetical protein
MPALKNPSCFEPHRDCANQYSQNSSGYLTLKDKIQEESVFPSLDALSDSDLIYSQQAANYLRLGRKTLDIWRCTGRYNLPYVKVGRRVCYRAGDLKAFIASRMRIHTGDGGAA